MPVSSHPWQWVRTPLTDLQDQLPYSILFPFLSPITIFFSQKSMPSPTRACWCICWLPVLSAHQILFQRTGPFHTSDLPGWLQVLFLLFTSAHKCLFPWGSHWVCAAQREAGFGRQWTTDSLTLTRLQAHQYSQLFFSLPDRVRRGHITWLTSSPWFRSWVFLWIPFYRLANWRATERLSNLSKVTLMSGRAGNPASPNLLSCFPTLSLPLEHIFGNDFWLEFQSWLVCSTAHACLTRPSLGVKIPYLALLVEMVWACRCVCVGVCVCALTRAA